MSLHQLIVQGIVGPDPIEDSVFFQYAGDGTIIACGDAEGADGVTRTGGESGEMIDLIVEGYAHVKFADGSTAQGPVTSDLNGYAVAAISAATPINAIAVAPAKFDAVNGVFAKGRVVLRPRTSTPA